MAELCARIIKIPTTKRMINIGMSHHLLLLQKNANSSRTIPRRPDVVCMALANPITFLLRYVCCGFTLGNSRTEPQAADDREISFCGFSSSSVKLFYPCRDIKAGPYSIALVG